MLTTLLVMIGTMAYGTQPDSAAARQPPAEPAKIALDAFTALATKCTQCHGTNVQKPKGRFGFVNDLRRLSADPQYVISGDPDESELWKVILDDSMPPKKATAGALTQPEKDAIRNWIAQGTPTVGLAPVAEGSPTPSSGENRASDRTSAGREVSPSQNKQTGPAQSFLQRITTMVGRGHVLVLHFPLALLLTAALVEAWSLLQRAPSGGRPTVRLLVALGTISAVVAAIMGWVHALDGYPGPFEQLMSTANVHRWLGTLAALAAVVVCIQTERDAARGQRSPLTSAGVLGLAALVGAAGHFGGLLTHGWSPLDF